jgi:hypothetical protein
VNQSFLLERARSQGDTAAGNSWHMPHTVMGENHRIGRDAISRYQQPSRQALLCRMKSIAGDRLRNLLAQSMRILKEQSTKCAFLLKHTVQSLRADLHCLA